MDLVPPELVDLVHGFGDSFAGCLRRSRPGHADSESIPARCTAILYLIKAVVVTMVCLAKASMR